MYKFNLTRTIHAIDGGFIVGGPNPVEISVIAENEDSARQKAAELSTSNQRGTYYDFKLNSVSEVD